MGEGHVTTKMSAAHLALLFAYGASARPLGMDVLDSIGLSPPRHLAPRRLTPTSSCAFGYASGFNTYGEVCADCLAPADWGSCTDWADCHGLYQ